MALVTSYSALDVSGTGVAPDDDSPPTSLVPTVELPVYGVRPVDRKWWIDQFMAEMDMGQFSNAGRLGDAMRRDGRYVGALEQRMAGLFGAPLELTPSRFGLGEEDDDNPKAVEIRDEIKQNWEKMFPRTELEELHFYGIMQGIGIAEKIWDTSTKPWTFKIKPRHPQFYLWLWQTGNYHLITLNRTLVRVPERSTQFINYTPYGYNRAFLNGRIRSLVDAWMIRGWGKSDWPHYNEMYGKMIKKAIVPQQADAKQEKEFVAAISKMSNNTTIKVRQDADGNKYDVELLEAKSTGWKTFPELMAWADSEISNVLLGQSMSTDGVGGLGAQEKPGEAVRSDIKAADNAKLCEALYTQALREYCEFNYGNADLAPRPNYQVEPEEDESKAAATDLATGQALVAFQTSTAPINVRAYLEERGYPLLSEEEESAMKQEAADKEAADTQAQREHDLALTAAKGGADSGPPKAKALHMVAESLKNFALAGAAVDTPAILDEHGIKHVDSED
jgi:hypothetical protein